MNLKPIELDQVKSYSLKERESKVSVKDFARPWTAGGSMTAWLADLPAILGAKDLIEIRDRIIASVRSKRPVILAMGAHAIKVGLNPILIHLLERRIVTGLAMNGACIIHDAEIAMVGKTSEDVAAEIGSGAFGMAEETGRFLNAAIIEGSRDDRGLGQSVGASLLREDFPFNRHSLLATAYALNVPVTVHVAIGTDIIHFHPAADGAAIGKASHRDFRLFARLVSELEGGVFINLGSAVLMPEVFLKALTLVRNLGHQVNDITTVNMDFIRHYRPMTNVVHRPTLAGGKGYSLVGHHEIMVPLLAAAVIEGLDPLHEKGNE